MGVLTGPEICRVVRETAERERVGIPAAEQLPPAITIEGFSEDRAGPNSYDLTLGGKFLTYQLPRPAGGDWAGWLNARGNNPTVGFDIEPGQPVYLEPTTLYLAHTAERTFCSGLVPVVDGRSSVGRLGVSVHITAGRGDDGFSGRWTLELTCIHPVILYVGMRICQITFHTTVGQRKPYAGRYMDDLGPVASRLWKTPE